MEISRAEIEKNINLVVDRLMNLGGADYSLDRQGNSASSRGEVQRDFGIEEWDWPQGVGLVGLEKLQDSYGDTRYDGFLSEWFRRNFSIGLPSRNINTTAPFLTLLSYAVRHNREDYIDECRKQIDYLLNDLPRTKENGFQHVTSAIGTRYGVGLNNSQLWIDTLFMAVLFMYSYADYTKDEELHQKALYQILLHIKYLYDKQSGLFYHGWSFDRNDNFGGIFWCRGNSWFTFGMTEYLAIARNLKMESGVREMIETTLRAQIDKLVTLQDEESGLWHTVLLDDSSYLEVSGSAAIAAGIYRAVELGIVDESYVNSADRAISGIIANIKPDGTVDNVSAGTGIGMDAQFYKNIIIRPMAYGQSMVLLALIEAFRRSK